MSHAQSGILVAHSKFGLFIEAMVVGELDALREGCQKFMQSLSDLQKQFPDASLGAVIAFGSDLWKRLSDENSAPELKPFRPLGKV